MNMKKKAAAACVAVMAAVSLPMGIVPVQPVQADLITDVIGGLQVKSALSKQIKHYDTTKEGQNEIYQAVTKRTRFTRPSPSGPASSIMSIIMNGWRPS